MAYSGHYDEAIENLNKALALKPDFFESYGHLGVAYEGKGDVPAAIEMYKRAAHESVNQNRAIEYMGRAFRAAAMSGDAARTKELFGILEKMPHDKSLGSQWEIGREA